MGHCISNKVIRNSIVVPGNIIIENNIDSIDSISISGDLLVSEIYSNSLNISDLSVTRVDVSNIILEVI